MASKAYFHRTYSLSITGNDVNVSIDSLDIRFEVNLYTGPRTGDASITIIGLTRDTIAPFEALTVIDPGEVINKNIIIELKAGYDGNNKTIFYGNLVSASVSAPPELALSLSAIAFSGVMAQSKEYTVASGTKLHDAVRGAIAEFGATLNITASVENEDIGEKVFTGDLISFVRQIENMANWSATYVHDKDGDTVILSDKNNDDVAAELSKTSGLLGVQSVTCYGATICTWLSECQCALANCVRLTSELNPSASGVYRVYKLQYKGAFRGKEWYTMFYGVRTK